MHLWLEMYNTQQKRFTNHVLDVNPFVLNNTYDQT